MFVTAEDFNVRPYKLPNIDAENEEFTAFVDNWCAEWYCKILGRSFYEKFIEGKDALPEEWSSTVDYVAADETQVVVGYDIYKVIVDNTDSKPISGNSNWELVESGNRWLKLIKGYSYTVGTKKYYWDGLAKAEKFAIFSEWLNSSITNVSGVAGVSVAKEQNGTLLDSRRDVCSAWNKFAKMIGGKFTCDIYNTLFGYLLITNNVDGTFDDTFDDSFDTFNQYLASEFTFPGNKNMFDL